MTRFISSLPLDPGRSFGPMSPVERSITVSTISRTATAFRDRRGSSAPCRPASWLQRRLAATGSGRAMPPIQRVPGARALAPIARSTR